LGSYRLSRESMPEMFLSYDLKCCLEFVYRIDNIAVDI
jgi:hypothetical protein